MKYFLNLKDERLEQSQYFIINHTVLLQQQIILSEFSVLCGGEPIISFVFHHILGGDHWIPGGSDHVPAH